MSQKYDEIAETIDIDGNYADSGAVDAQLRFPVAVDERFRFVCQLGSGGMGMVYQAYDNVLQRNVALKFLINKTKENLPLLVSEARAQAALSHKYLCPIYEVLESEQSVYIAMQYIEGSNLQELSSTLSQEQNLLLIMQCAQALEAAHRAGMVHRDFKPLNVMIKATNEGLEPSIVDFGLACSTSVTDKQPRLVSLRFTAPEQLSSKQNPIDRRVDVYSLGATLYYCLLRESPPQLDENNPQLPINKAQWQALPKDIQLIIEKCMKVNVSERYANANQVAEDIQRYLNGEPISVHPGWVYRAVTKIKKHKWLATAVAAVFLVSTAALINLRHDAQVHALREQALVKFNNEIKELEHEVQLTLLSPRHNITQRRQRWLQKALLIENSLPEINPVIRSTAQYAIGRIYLVVGDFSRALKHLKEAHLQERTSLSAFYLAIAYTERYKQEVEKLRSIKDKAIRKARAEVANKTFKAPALRLLSANLVSAPHPAYAEALVAYLSDEWDKVLHILTQAKELPSWFYQDEILKGDIALSKASEMFNAGEPVELVLEQVQFARDNYHEASLIAKSDPDVAVKPYIADLFGLKVHTQAGLAWENQPLLALQKRYQELSQIDTNSPSFHEIYGQMAHYYGLHLHYIDGNPQPWFVIAEQELLAANEHHKPENQLWMALAQLYSSMFSHLTAHNLSANEVTQKGVEAMNKVPSGQRDYYYYNELGTLYRFRGTQKNHSGKDGMPLFEKAVEAYLEAYERNPEFSGSLINAASALRDSVSIQNYQQYYDAMAKGRELLNQAMQSEQRPFVSNYYLTVFDVEAIVLALYHEKPTENLFQVAEQHLQKLREINQSHPYILDLGLRLKQYRAEFAFTQNPQWLPEFDGIIEEREQLLSRFPNNTIVMRNYANFMIQLTVVRHLLGLPIAENVDKISNAITRFPDYQGARSHLAMLELFRYWTKQQSAPKNLYQKYQFNEMTSGEQEWIRVIVLAYDASDQGEATIARQKLDRDKSMLPAFKTLIARWIEHKVILFQEQ